MFFCLFADAVLTVSKGKLMADKLLASGGMTKDKSVRVQRGRGSFLLFWWLRKIIFFAKLTVDQSDVEYPALVLIL